MADLTPFEELGGSEKVAELVAHFYHIMDTDPHAKAVRAVHEESLEQAASKLRDFLTGWLGGPSIYIEKYGHPRMRMRHMKFPIGMIERNEWLYCMSRAMDAMNIQGQLRQQMWGAFQALAEQIRNRD